MKDNYFYNNFHKRDIKSILESIGIFFIKKIKKLNLISKITIGLVVILIIFYFLFFSAPRSFFNSGDLLFKIKDGSTVQQIGNNLIKDKLIRSSFVFNFLIKLTGGQGKIKAGSYLFDRPQNVFLIIQRFLEGEQGYDPIKLVIPEGASVKDISLLMGQKVKDFNEKKFLVLAKPYEGYLFPDTYYLPPDETPEMLLGVMQENFYKKISPLLDNIKNFGKSLEEVIIMASILEEEARTMESRQMISGILWKRIDIGMPLQVDATFLYINGKNTYELTLDDLQDDSSLYNTYTHKGLPIGPISNPGLDSIWAAINPTKSSYFYYLSDRSGNMYYAKDFEGHKENRVKYLHTY